MNSLYLNVFVDGVTDLLVCRFRTVGIQVDEDAVYALGDDDLHDVGIRGVGDTPAGMDPKHRECKPASNR